MTRRIALAVLLVLALSGAAQADPVVAQADEIQDILRLVQSGVSEEVVVKHIQSSGFAYELTTEDILRLRDEGVSDKILAAMLDTALPADGTLDTEVQADTDRVVTRDDGDSTVQISAGYFSPWYNYPYAWGFYYDPFPSCYSLYYYPPFSLSYGWGWYGNCHYYYPSYWGGSRWCSPYYSQYGSYRRGYTVGVPRTPNASSWQAGRGLPSRHAGMPPRTRNAYDRRNVETMRAERLARSIDRDRIHVRTVRDVASSGMPRRSANAVPARRGQSNRAPGTITPRVLNAPGSRQTPHVSPSRGSAPTMAPRSAPAPRGASFAPSPRGGMHAAAPHGGSGRGGMGASAPRGGSGRAGMGASMPRSR